MNADAPGNFKAGQSLVQLTGPSRAAGSNSHECQHADSTHGSALSLSRGHLRTVNRGQNRAALSGQKFVSMQPNMILLDRGFLLVAK